MKIVQFALCHSQCAASLNIKTLINNENSFSSLIRSNKFNFINFQNFHITKYLDNFESCCKMHICRFVEKLIDFEFILRMFAISIMSLMSSWTWLSFLYYVAFRTDFWYGLINIIYFFLFFYLLFFLFYIHWLFLFLLALLFHFLALLFCEFFLIFT